MVKNDDYTDLQNETTSLLTSKSNENKLNDAIGNIILYFFSCLVGRYLLMILLDDIFILNYIIFLT